MTGSSIASPKRRFWVVLMLLFALLLVGGIVAWFVAPRTVATAQAKIAPAVEVVYATGVVEPRHLATVAARVTAPVRAVLAVDGEHVRQGQALVLLENAQQRALLAQARANRIKADHDAARISPLYAHGWLTRNALDTAIAEKAATHAAESAAAALLDQYVVRAGGDGIVLRRTVEPGDLVTPSMPLMLVGNPADIWITATVDERDVPKLQPGQVTLMRSDAWPDRVMRGKLAEVTPGGDATQRAFRARILLDRAEALPIGLSLEVNIVLRQHDRAVLVPASAVKEGHAWTFSDGRARQVPIKIGITAADTVEILSGLAPGQRVILNPPADLKDGARVKANR
jgi:RND family efflux transporter MFP subunit